MRRPLCLIGLVYVAAIIIAMTVTVRGAPVYDHLDGREVAIAGYVDWKEYRISGEDKTLVITLKDAVILKEDQIANLKQILSDSESISDSGTALSSEPVTKHYWKQNKDLLRREDAQGIEGVLCYLEQGKTPCMGSLVIMQGTFYSFSHATNPGEFDSAEYYRLTDQQGRLMKAECTVPGGGQDEFRENLYQIREYLSLLMDACYDEEDASVMKAMLLGEKGTIDRDVKSLYQKNGIIHILAISGLHLSIIGMGLYKVFAKIRFPILVNIILTTGMMYCYGTMTGMGTSMTRAYIMFALHLGAKLAGRTYDRYTALVVAALFVLLQQPLYLRHSGFLFSFGAVCGIGLFLPAVERNLFTGSRIEKMLLSGMAVSISTLPVYLCFYYEFPPYSVLLNLIVIPCMTMLLAGGLCCLGLAVLFLPFAMVVSYPVHFILWLYEQICVWCMSLPSHTWITGCPEAWQVVLFLGIITAVILLERRIPKLLFWEGVLCALCVFTIELPKGLEITMVDVGQGDCIYLAEDGGVRFLIDGGSSDHKDVSTYQILPFLKYKGVNYLDAVFVTHPDSDHENGIRAWLQEYEENGIQIGILVLPDVTQESRNEEYRELESLAAKHKVPVHYIGVGEKLSGKKVMLTCLHPERGCCFDDTNAYSIVLHLTYGDFSALFTGDLEGEGEQMLLDKIREGWFAEQTGKQEAEQEVEQEAEQEAEQETEQREERQPLTLLKVAHHGSRNSTPEEFLELVQPRIALISAGRDNSYGHPHEETLNRLADAGSLVFTTQEYGAVTLEIGKKMKIFGFKK